MAFVYLPIKFFAALVEFPPIYRLLWIEWLAEKSHLLYHPTFCENLRYKNVPQEKIKECYALGMKFLEGGNLFDSPAPAAPKEKPQEIDPQLIIEIIGYLNERASSAYKPQGKNADLIRARLREGYSKEDFFKVIDNKGAEWTGTEYEKFLRPITLFSKEKFDNYLNQKNAKPNSKVGKLRDAVEQATGRLFD
jgi:uncharacterized phage protein (TIGR02220 family)